MTVTAITAMALPQGFRPGSDVLPHDDAALYPRGDGPLLLDIVDDLRRHEVRRRGIDQVPGADEGFVAVAAACHVVVRRRRVGGALVQRPRSEEHTSELQSLMRTSYAVFCLKKKNTA